jgi:hypothetical protein
MPRRTGRLLTGCLLALSCLGAPLLADGTTEPASAAPISHCTTTTGVIVVVDFRHFGGAIDRGCSPTPTTGYAALHNAGYTTAPDQEDGPAFVCRIDGEPTPAQDACVHTPPTSASWSYWYADAGHNTWSFHELGAMSTHPAPGSVDAWVFGSTEGGGTSGEPSFSPASVRATAAGPTTSARPTPTPASTHSPARHHPHASATPAPGATTTPTPSRSATPHAKHRHPARPSPTPTSPSAATSPTASGPAVVDAVGSDPTPPASKNSPTGLLVGAGLIVVLGGAGGFTAWRRRHRST